MSNEIVIPMIIAEFGSVHDGSFGNACKLIEAAAASGADVVKFQTHIPEAETLRNAPSPKYFKGEPRFEYFERTGFTETQWVELKKKCDECGVSFLSSPFSLEAVELLERVGVNLYKIPSGEVTNTPLLERVAQTKKPVLLSSGMSDYSELDRAVKILKNGGPLIVMQCTSEYPCPPEKVGLNVISELKSRYKTTIGFSDHTLGNAASFAAAALGADVIEKHFTFSRLMYGSDAINSMEPDEFLIFSQGLKDIWTMLNANVDKNDISPYFEMKQIFEKSIVTAIPLQEGHLIALNDLAFKKPGNGIPASEWPKLIGRKINKNLSQNHQISQNDLL